MASGVTNRGAKILADFLRGATSPTALYIALVKDDVVPNVDINTLSELAEIAAGNGYSAGGYLWARNSTDFDTLTEDDALNQATLRPKILSSQQDLEGPSHLPAKGSPMRFSLTTTQLLEAAKSSSGGISAASSQCRQTQPQRFRTWKSTSFLRNS